MKRIFLLAMVLFLAGTTLAQSPVEPQPPRPDGSIVHVVQFGETLEGILAAYAKYNVTMDNLLVYNQWRFRPQFIFVDDQIVILPPGAVDPATGELVAGFTPPVAVTDAPTTQAATPEPTTISAPVATPPANLPSEPGAPVFQAISPFLPSGSESASVEIAVVVTEEVPTEAATQEVELTQEATEESVPTITPTSEATEELAADTAATEEALPTNEPTEPATVATEEVAPTETQEVVETPLPSLEPLAVANVPDFTSETGFICARFFDDANLNARFETSEALLTGGTLTIGENEQIGAEDVLCFADMPPGENQVVAVAPEGYGLTTSPSLKVLVVAGQTTEIVFGASEGYHPPATPVPVQETLDAPLPQNLEAAKNASVEADTFRLSDYSAYLVLAVAAAFFVGGGAIIVALRSFR